jgi:hypothetical protein
MYDYVQFYAACCTKVSFKFLQTYRSVEISANHDVSVTSLVIGCKHSRCENSLAMYGAEYGMNLWLLDERLLSTVPSRTSQGRPMDNHVQRKRRSLITTYCYIIIFFVEMLAQ